MLAPAATVLPLAGAQLTPVTVPADTLGTQLAASASAPAAALLQVSVRPL